MIIALAVSFFSCVSFLHSSGIDSVYAGFIPEINKQLEYTMDEDLIKVVSTHYKVCFLEDIDYSNLEVIKICRTWNRAVYYDRDYDVYIKIWPKDYALSFGFVNAVKKNFYQSIAPLQSIIFDRSGACRGYITYAVQALCEKIENFSCANFLYKGFFEVLKDRVLKTGLIYYDLVPGNVVCDGVHYFLIDLEPVLDIESCKKNIFNFNEFLSGNLPEYADFIKDLLLSYS